MHRVQDIGCVPRKSGIYAIRNIQTGHTYIGRALDLKSRMDTHLTRLEMRNHHCKALQASWETWGSESFRFIVLFNCDADCLDSYEWFATTLVGPSLLLNAKPVRKKLPPPKSTGVNWFVVNEANLREKRESEHKAKKTVDEMRSFLLSGNVADFSRRCGVSEDTIHRWIKGDCNPQRRTFGRMLDAFNEIKGKGVIRG